MAATPDRAFLAYSAAKMQQLAGRITDCLGRLNYDQVWRRGSDNENAIGNLVLHLSGNVRQWIGTGVGGRKDVRVRDREFAARGDIQPAELAERLDGVVGEAISIIEQVSLERLTDPVTIQGFTVTILEAIYHVVEHFFYHAGHIFFATKLQTGEDLAYSKHVEKSSPHGETVP